MLASPNVIRDAVLHLFNEQPLVADLFEMPGPGDLALICTNLRMLNRKRPIFVDDSASTFLFPLSQVRFVEIPPAAGPAAQVPALPAATGQPDELDLDEELLRRVREL